MTAEMQKVNGSRSLYDIADTLAASERPALRGVGELLRQHLPDKAAARARLLGEKSLALEIHNTIGDHRNVIRLLKRSGNLEGVVSYCESRGLYSYGVGFALNHGLEDTAYELAHRVIDRYYANEKMRNLDYSHTMVEMAIKTRQPELAEKIAWDGVDYFRKRNDPYSAARLLHMIGSDYAADVVRWGLSFLREDGTDYRKLLGLAGKLGVVVRRESQMNLELPSPTTTSSSILTPPNPSM